MIYKCPSCEYITNIKCNMTRHYMRRHYDTNKIELNTYQNNTADQPNNTVAQPNNTTIFSLQCNKCNKILSSKQKLNYHTSICKGILNSLECYICHKILSNQGSKSRHMKICKEQQEAIILSTEIKTPSVINNTTNNVGRDLNTINTVNNIHQINNITILTVDPNKLDELDFVTDHITNPQLKNILKITHQDVSDTKKVNMLEAYMRQLMSNPINKCIQKTNLQNVYSQIHTGDNKWETKHDKELYPKLTCNVAQGLSGLMISRNDDTPMIKTERKLEELRTFLDYMSDEGYRNDSDPDINHKTHLLFKELVHRIKSVVFDMTKITL